MEALIASLLPHLITALLTVALLMAKDGLRRLKAYVKKTPTKVDDLFIESIVVALGKRGIKPDQLKG